MPPAIDTALVARGGAKISRVTFDWRAVEAERDRYRLDRYDAMYRELRRRGLRPLWVMLAAPPWAWEPSATCVRAKLSLCNFPPARASQDEWREIVSLVAERYPQSAGIEIWNETNLRLFWTPGPDPRRYTELLRDAYAAAKAQNPSIPVIGGGLSNLSRTSERGVALRDFLRAVYRFGGRGSMDGIGLHAYPTAEGSPDWLGQAVDDARAARDSAGDEERPLWITEIGVSTTGARAVSDKLQAEMLKGAYNRAAKMDDVRAFVVHTLIEPPRGEGDGETGFGVLRHDLVAKPAYCLLARLAGQGRRCTPGTVPLSSGPAPRAAAEAPRSYGRP